MYRLPAYTSWKWLLSCTLLCLLLAMAGCGASPTPPRTTTAVLPATGQHATHTTPVPSSKAQATSVASSSPLASLPTRLIIPAIGVNANVEHVDVTPDGNLAVPQQNPWVDVGWYASGPRPGERGSAVIDGHLDRPGGSPAVFWYLRNLRTGDEVQILDAQGKLLRFRVTNVAYYAPQDAPIQEIFANESGTYLNLITCAGDWIPSQHQTTQRLVVYTTLE